MKSSSFAKSESADKTADNLDVKEENSTSENEEATKEVNNTTDTVKTAVNDTLKNNEEDQTNAESSHKDSEQLLTENNSPNKNTESEEKEEDKTNDESSHEGSEKPLTENNSPNKNTESEEKEEEPISDQEAQKFEELAGKETPEDSEPLSPSEKEINIEDVNIDTKFESFLKNSTIATLIDPQTLKQAQEDLEDPEARTVLNTVGKLAALNMANGFVEPTFVGTTIATTLSASAAALAWASYQVPLMAIKNIFIRYQNRNLNKAGGYANLGCIPFVGNALLALKLAQKKPDLMNCFFADQFSRKSRRKIKEATDKLHELEHAIKPNIQEIKYYKKQLKKWQRKQKETVQAGLMFIPKIKDRINAIKKIPKKVFNWIKNPFKQKNNSAKE